jgi:inosine-uridine nucleoside N-ribohydrolase
MPYAMIARVRIAFDMETVDPDDVLTLCLLATHPAVELAAVSVNPGSRVQVGVVRRLLERLDRTSVPIGARDPGRPSGNEVSQFHFDWLDGIAPRDPDMAAHEVLAAALAADPATVLLSGAPLHNVRDLLREHPDVRVERWVAQGGFAGDNIVPARLRLSKFAGATSTESHNFGANKKATLAVLADPRVRERRLVAKNVTHAVAWDPALHAAIARLDTPTLGVRLMYEAMDVYLREHREGKLLHDPIAAWSGWRSK